MNLVRGVKRKLKASGGASSIVDDTSSIFAETETTRLSLKQETTSTAKYEKR